MEDQISKKKYPCASSHGIASNLSLFITNLTGRISFLPLADRSLPLLAAKASDRQRGCSVNRSVCPCDTENQIFGCWVVMNKHLPVFIPHPRVGLALRLIKGTFFHVCLFCQSPGFFPSFPTPRVGFGLGGRSCRTKLLHATTKSAEVGWRLADYGGLMSCVGREEASLEIQNESSSLLGQGEENLKYRRGTEEVPVCSQSHPLLFTQAGGMWAEVKPDLGHICLSLCSTRKSKHPWGKRRRRQGAGALSGRSNRAWCTVLD